MNIDKIKIKQAMARKGIQTQTELAELLSITKNQLSLILSDKFEPLKSNVKNLCELLDISPVDIITDNSINRVNEFNSTYLVTKNTDDMSIKAIELFAGAGGLALGLEKANIDTVAHVEINKYCCETLWKNRPNWNIINDDVSNVDFKPYRNSVDVVTGGFPCQAFSYAGKKLGFDDTRGTLFYEFARCVKETDPLLFMAENVRGLISHDNGRTLQTIIDIFEELGYKVEYKLLNAVNYGVAQKRERIVIIGTKNNIQFEFPKEDENIKVLKDILKDVPKSEGQKYSDNKKKVLELVPAGGCWRHLPKDIQQAYMGKSYYSGGGRTGMARRLSWDEPSLTLTCSPSQKQTERCHPDETRPFTVREYARIQSFPDDWEFIGGIGEKYKQIGNAVPVELAYRIAQQIYNSIHTYKKDIQNN